MMHHIQLHKVCCKMFILEKLPRCKVIFSAPPIRTDRQQNRQKNEHGIHKSLKEEGLALDYA